MKKRSIITVIAVTILFTTQAQNFQWVKTIGGEYNDFGYSIALDASGNVYSTGSFGDTVDFDPGPGVFNMISPSPGISTYISKLDHSGNFVWAKNMGTTLTYGGQSITTDAMGYLYTFSDKIINKLDSAGNIIWSKQIGGSTGGIPGGGLSSGRSIAVDASGNVYAVGNYQNTSDFDPGPGVFNLTAASANSADIFVCKLDASGNFVWAKSMGSTSDDGGFSIAVDHLGKVYTTGYFKSSADFDPGAGTYNLTAGGSDIFVSKLNASGDFVWAKNMGGASYDFGKSIAVDSSNNVYTTGYFFSTADFDPGAGTYNLTGTNQDIFVSKLSGSGNFIWAKQIGGTGSGGNEGNAIAVDASSNIFIIGDFSGTADFDPGAGTYNLVAQGYSDIFVSELNSSGNFVFAKNMGGSNGEGGLSITADASGNQYVSGTFYGTCDFDPGSVVFNRTAVGASDIFIEKLGQGSSVTVRHNINVQDFSFTPSYFTANLGDTIVWNWISGSHTTSSTTIPAGAASWSHDISSQSGNNSFIYIPTVTGDYNYQCNIHPSTMTGSFTVCVQITSQQATISAGGTTTFCSGGSVVLSAATSGLAYQWKNNGSPISGATLQSYTATAAGAYICDVSNSCGATPSNTIYVYVNAAPTVGQATISANGSTTICQGQNVVLTVATSGFSYQWKRGNKIVSGAISQSYTVNKAATYTCIVSNSCGSVTSNAIAVTTTPAPTATVSMGSCSGGAVLLTCTFTPTSGVALQWTKANVNISGATNPTYSATSKGTYKCIATITATGCTKASNAAKVTITCRNADVVTDDDEVIVYPNPSSNYFIINTDQLDRESEIYVYDLTGRLVESSELNGEEIKVGASLSNGMYFLKIVMDGEVQQVIKLIKNF